MPDTVSGTQIYLLFGVNLMAIVAGVGKGLSVLMSVRDEIRDMRINIGMKDPPSGLLGDVKHLQGDVRNQRESMIEVRSKLGFKHPTRRIDDES